VTRPTPAAIRDALRDHGLHPVLLPGWDTRGRPWSAGLRGVLDHHTAGVNSLGYLRNLRGRYPFVQAHIAKDGTYSVLTALSSWGSGQGGPWRAAGIPRDLAHLYLWQVEVESLGRRPDFTDAQLDALGRGNAAILDLAGLPRGREINHRDWTDGSGGVSAAALPTRGRKVDTLYAAKVLRANTDRFRISA